MASSAYELLESYVNLTTRGLADTLAKLDLVRNKAIAASNLPVTINVNTNISGAAVNARLLNDHLAAIRQNASGINERLASWDSHIRSSASSLITITEILDEQNRILRERGPIQNQTETATVSLGAQFFKLAAAIGAVALAKRAAFASITEATGREVNQTALTQLIGDSEKARLVLQDVRQLAEESIFSFPDLRQAAVQMAAMGTSADVLVDRLRRIVTIGAATGANISNIIRQYTQAQAKGILMAEDLRVLAENGIPVYRLLSELTGRNVMELRKLGEQGKLSFDLLDAAFRKATERGGQFFGTLERSAATARGQFRAISDATLEIGGNIAEWDVFNFTEEMDGLKRILQDVEHATRRANQAIDKAAGNQLGDPVQKAGRLRLIDIFTGYTFVLRVNAALAKQREEIEATAAAAQESAAKTKQAFDQVDSAAAGDSETEKRAAKIKAATDAAVKSALELSKRIAKEVAADWDDVIDRTRKSQSQADALRKAFVSPMEEFTQKISEAAALLDSGFIDRTLFDQVFAKARDDMEHIERAAKNVSIPRTRFELGTADHLVFRLERTREQDQQLQSQQRSVTLQAEANKILGEIRSTMQQVRDKPEVTSQQDFPSDLF